MSRSNHHQHWARGFFCALVLGVVTAACSALTHNSEPVATHIVCVPR